MAVIVMGLMWALCGAFVVGQEAPAPSPLDDPEAYAVYASLLPDHWLVAHARATTLVIRKETVTGSDRLGCLPSGGRLDTDWRPVVESYQAANAAAHAVMAGDRLGRPYIVVPSAEIRAAFEGPPSPDGGAWTEFHRRYPASRGFMQVSAVGFDAEKKRAMVYLAHYCGVMCGGGRHYLLEKREDGWHEVKLEGVTQCMWVS
jgi:hypothetical protein